MKKHRKLIISALVCLTGVTLATSVTSTAAWFLYATRVTAAYTGTSAHCSKLLQMAVGNTVTNETVWKTDLVKTDLPDAKFEPITSGEQASNGALNHLYAAPDYRQGLYANWLTAKTTSYSQFTLWLKLTDVDENYGTENQKYLANDVYLTDLTIMNANNAADLANAVRVHFNVTTPGSGSRFFLFSKSGASTNVGGCLDLNEDGEVDFAGYSWEQTPCIYGGTYGGAAPDVTITRDQETNKVTGAVLNNPAQQASLSSDSGSGIIATDTKGVLSGGTPIGSTSATAGQYLKIVVTIWLEGWALLNSNVIWDSATYSSKDFNVGMTFGVQLHADNE